MKRFVFGILVTFFLTLFLVVRPGLAASYPDYSGYVNDYAHVLSESFVKDLNNKLSDYDKKTSNQIAVVTIDTTGSETIEQYSIHLADKWKPGQKGKDNGVVMLFAMKDRKMRIEVGRGLEGELTDLKSRRIIADIMTPEFKASHYEAGIAKGVDSVISIISPNVSVSPVLTTQSSNDPSAGAIILIVIIVIIVILLLVAISPYTPLGGEGTIGITGFWVSSDSGDSDSDSGNGGTSFGGGSFSGGGASGGW